MTKGSTEELAKSSRLPFLKHISISGIVRPVFFIHNNTILLSLQALFDEANKCIADCEEANSAEAVQEEGKLASEAVDQAFAAFIDLLEDLRRANDTQKEYYRDVREQSANRLKLLRRELDGIVEKR